VAFGFFALGGATVALWVEYWLRDRREAKAKLERQALSCTAAFTFTKSSDGTIDVVFDSAKSENVGYWLWYVNNGGSMHNEGVLLFVEFGKEVSRPEIFAHSLERGQKWLQLASTNRFMFVEMEGWPTGDVVLQAFNSASLGLDRRSELKV